MVEFYWKFAEGEVEEQKALELDPNDATARQWYAEDLGWIGGRQKQALAEIARARELDPMSPIIAATECEIKMEGHDFDGAISDCKDVTAKFPEFPRAHEFLARAYAAKGLYTQAIDEDKMFDQLAGDPQSKELTSAFEDGFRSGGVKAATQRTIEVLKQQAKKSYVSPVQMAGLYATLGDKDQAFAWLYSAYRERSHEAALVGFRSDYRFDSLKSDPRYAELGRKMGLPPLP
jgi:tetratricopeptide (TPR) repeat protein